MTILLDEYAITTPRSPGVIHSVWPALRVHQQDTGGPPGLGSFESFTATVTDNNEAELKAGVADVTYSFRTLSVSVYTGTANVIDMNLILMNGTGGAEVGRLHITPDANMMKNYWLVFEEPVVLTIATGLFSLMDGALGDGAAYTVAGTYWKYGIA